MNIQYSKPIAIIYSLYRANITGLSWLRAQRLTWKRSKHSSFTLLFFFFPLSFWRSIPLPYFLSFFLQHLLPDAYPLCMFPILLVFQPPKVSLTPKSFSSFPFCACLTTLLNCLIGRKGLHCSYKKYTMLICVCKAGLSYSKFFSWSL